jgi:hypothetical protein
MACTILRDGGRVLSRRTGVWILAGVTLLVTAAAMFAPRIAQPLSYHHFADQRSWLGIPNFGDVASNLGFAVVGLWGLWALLAAFSHEGQGYRIDSEFLQSVFLSWVLGTWCCSVWNGLVRYFGGDWT